MDNVTATDVSTGESFRSTALSLVVFCSAALAIILTTLFVGGQPWAVLCLVTLVIQAVADRRCTALALVLPALLWLILFRATGNRELFFPYAMYLAAHISLLHCWRSYLLSSIVGSLIVAAFLFVRFQQSASWQVLSVELGVAAAILGLIFLASLASPKNIYTHTLIASVASLLAYAGLAL